MDPRFYAKVLEELRKLVAAEEAGTQPENRSLVAAVYAVVRSQNPEL